MESILNTIKPLVGIPIDDDSFDTDIIISINTVIFSLSQLGIGPTNGFIVSSIEDKWSDYLNNTAINLEGVKTYMHLKTKLLFDPPTNSTVIESINNTLKEMEFRMMLAVETNNLEN